MKRTLYTILALAAVAYAAPTETVVDPSLASSQPANTEAAAQSATDELTVPAENLPELKQQEGKNTRNAIGIFGDVNVGTQGIGFDIGYEFNKYIKLRFRSAFLSYTFNDTFGDGTNEADVEIKLNGNNSGLLLDVHPFGGSFRITTGLNFNPLSITAFATMDAQGLDLSQYGDKVYSWGGHDYRVNGEKGDSAWVDGKYKWRTVQPYFGIGWSSDGDGDRSVYFHFDLGVNFMGSGSFSICSGGPIEQRSDGGDWVPVDNGVLRDSVMEEGKDFFKIADKLYVYPVLQLGLGVRF